MNLDIRGREDRAFHVTMDIVDGEMPLLTQVDKNGIVGLYEDGIPARDIASTYMVHECTINHVVTEYYLRHIENEG